MNIAGCKIVLKAGQDGRTIAITFDDGPHKNFTPQILDILEKRGAYGTFFSTGNNISAQKSLASELVRRGHLLANHTYTHVNPLFTRKSRLYDEILRTKELIEEITGQPNLFFRPPYGIITPSLLSICSSLNLSIVLWSINSYDFRREQSAVIIKRIKRRIRPGGIMLFHECKYNNEGLDYSNTLQALEVVLEIAGSKGIKGIRIDGVT